MSIRLKTVLLCTMGCGLFFGFLHHLIAPDIVNFERLHIFLFNLCSGGTLIIYYTEEQRSLSLKGKLFCVLSFLFALASFLEYYAAAAILPVLLALISEKVRYNRFGQIFPYTIFSPSETTSRKFHQASLLCLSLSLLLSGPVIANDAFFHWFSIEKLKLDTFFLGFSFPVSLISMSVIFSLMKKSSSRPHSLVKNISFWIINLGVIVFFLFILANLFIPQVIIASLLFGTVLLILYVYWIEGDQLQQKAFLVSGILFLIVTSITGILYIMYAFSPGYTSLSHQPLLRLHAFTALYGWNLSGLTVIARHNDFPIQLHSQKTLALHWITVFIFCPLGYFSIIFGCIAVVCYIFLLFNLLFKSGKTDTKMVIPSPSLQ